MDRSINQRHLVRKGLLWVLAVIGSGTVLYSAGAAGLRILRDRPPDSRMEMMSPDGRHRIVITEDLAGFPGATIIADISNAPQIPSDSFDCIIFTQTLQYVFDPHAAVRTLWRILKPGGTVLATVPGISLHALPR